MQTSVAVVGAGAVGCFFGAMLARAGMPVTLIGRQEHVAVWKRDGLVLESSQFPAQLAVSASTELEAARNADLVLLCVKTLDLEVAASALAPILSPGAVVLCFQNGVDHAERFHAASGRQAIPAAVYVAAEIPAPGRVRHNGRGDLVIGSAPTEQLSFVADLFKRAEVPCRISDNMEGDLWLKLIMNCAYNAQSAIAQASYGLIVAQPDCRRVLIETVNECVAVAHALGITLPHPDPVAAALELGETTMKSQRSSTAQDMARGKLTEIDSLNGHVVRRGAAVSVPTPVNATLHALVKLCEQTRVVRREVPKNP